jgi:hypothetical protein
MVQASGISLADALVEISENGSTWTDISGWAASVSPGPSVRKYGLAYTHEGDTAIITTGKREPVDAVVNIVYTEGTGDPFEVVRQAHENNTDLYARWSPQGGSAGDFQFSTGAARVTEYNPPPTEAESGDPVTVNFTVTAPSFTKSVVAT